MKPLLSHALLGFAALLTLTPIGCHAGDPKAAKPKASSQPLSKPQDLTSMTEAELRQKLTPLQYQVTKQNGTEPPFRNEYNDNKEPGIYVDVISGEPLFASIHKFDSGTGWPSFWQPLKKEAVVEKQDGEHGMLRTEVRSQKSDAHLGHVFPDGPKPTGQRYCMNSASLRFIPVDKLAEFGFAEYLSLFEKK